MNLFLGVQEAKFAWDSTIAKLIDGLLLSLVCSQNKVFSELVSMAMASIDGLGYSAFQNVSIKSSHHSLNIQKDVSFLPD
jgi:hypothetical protein